MGITCGSVPAKRDELFNKYIPLANKIANNEKKDVPKCVQLEELVSAAYCGLLDAATKYDKEKNDQFPLYGKIRILGEINDYLRKCTWAGRGKKFYGWSLDVPVYGSRSTHLPLQEGLANEYNLTTYECEEFFTNLT